MKLVNWYFSAEPHNQFFAHGKVFGHHRFKEGKDIQTSRIEELRYDEDNKSFHMKTHSGSQYELLLEEIHLDLLEKTEPALSFFDISTDVLEECWKMWLKSKTARQEKAAALLEEQELYLLIEENESTRAYYKNEYGVVREIPVKRHIGMFDDTWLLYDERSEIDFRWFDRFQAMEPYEWTENIKYIHIENKQEFDLEFQKMLQVFQICKKNEAIIVEREKFYSGN